MVRYIQYITLAIFLTLMTSCLNDPEIYKEIKWISMEDAQNASAHDGKKIMVEVYTEWCEFCKKLEEQVLPDSTVISNLNKYYHSVKLNGESDEIITFNGSTISKAEFAKNLGVRSYPTILFIDPAGELILQINGYMPVGDFQSMLVYIGEEAYNKTEFHEFVADR